MKPLFYLLFLSSTIVLGQRSTTFNNEVQAIKAKYDTIWDSSKETTVFTGSSSIRMWKNLEDMFPEHQIVNTGFGGSKAIDLLQHQEELIHRFNPKKVFIYEGDNDIVFGTRTKRIIETTKQIISNIKQRNNNVQIVLIAAKPSIARWSYKRKYKRLNRKFKKLARKENGVKYADVWNAMLDGRQVKQDIFIKDGLHLNDKGYDLWFSVIAPYMNTNTTK
ncbi:GDSL-type esterase/lipase family protein [Arenibacter latericius]|uniref:GDSL-type esterase/lipase family protein n=1 Tax=Arenibacter latericius TaxID=86104 RepID=UPI00040BA965|nr:GDSL-type esterase/lipase family protein [Arenibacter latericius]MDX1363153.1 GDSL-type esterase/lipase family protein [Arenibacter latericius]